MCVCACACVHVHVCVRVLVCMCVCVRVCDCRTIFNACQTTLLLPLYSLYMQYVLYSKLCAHFKVGRTILRILARALVHTHISMTLLEY